MSIQTKAHLMPKAEKLIQGGLTVAKACKKVGISVPSFYNYRNKGKVAVKTVRAKKSPQSPKQFDLGGALLVLNPTQTQKLFSLLARL